MPDPSTRTFGRRTFVRLGVAAGGLGMLAGVRSCRPAARGDRTQRQPSPPIRRSQLLPRPPRADHGTSRRGHATAAAARRVNPRPRRQARSRRSSCWAGTTSRRWSRRTSTASCSRTPNFKIDYEPIAGDYLVDLLTRFRAKTPMDVIYVRDQYHASWVESGFLQPLDETDEINALYADMFPYNANQMQWKGKKYGLPYYTDFDVFA